MTEEAAKKAYEEIDKNLDTIAAFYDCTVDEVQRDILLEATRDEIKAIHSAITFDDMVGRRRLNSMAASAKIFMFCWMMLGVIGAFAIVFRIVEYLMPIAE